jgi:uncharacterized coiled-coil protein SlyX
MTDNYTEQRIRDLEQRVQLLEKRVGNLTEMAVQMSLLLKEMREAVDGPEDAGRTPDA